MKFLFSSLILVFLFVAPIVALADEQTVTLTAEVSDSFHWLYAENTKQLIVGSVITVVTILIVLGIYYLVKML